MVYLYSTINMMHGPINITSVHCLSCFVNCFFNPQSLRIYYICASVLIVQLTTQLFTEHAKNEITELKCYGPSNLLTKAFPYHSLYIHWQHPSRPVLYKSVFIEWLSVNAKVTHGIGQIFFSTNVQYVTLNFTEEGTIFLGVPSNLIHYCHLLH